MWLKNCFFLAGNCPSWWNFGWFWGKGSLKFKYFQLSCLKSTTARQTTSFEPSMMKIGSGVFTGYAFKESDTYIYTYIYTYIQKKCLYFTPMWGLDEKGDLNPLWQTCRTRRRNQFFVILVVIGSIVFVCQGIKFGCFAFTWQPVHTTAALSCSQW